MTDLICRALLGDAEAQKECTAQGIALPCPFCSREIPKIRGYMGLTFYKCRTCGATVSFDLPKYNKGLANTDAAWNTRAKPPVGECGTCQRKHLRGREWFCEVRGILHDLDDFCSYYEPREAKEAQKCKDLCKDL